MGFRSNDQDADIADINVVPLVDIILVVLIIFMVTAPMILKPSINVNLPSASTGEETTPSRLNLSIVADGTIMLDGAAVDEVKLREVAVGEVQKNPDVQAIISADKDVPHGKVVGLLDVIKSSGVKKFAISIEKQAQSH